MNTPALYLFLIYLLTSCGENPRGSKSFQELGYIIPENKVCFSSISSPGDQSIYPGELKNININANYADESESLAFSTCNSSDVNLAITCNTFTGTAASIDIQAGSSFNKVAMISFSLIDGNGDESEIVTVKITPSFHASCKEAFDDGITTDGVYTIDSDETGPQDPYPVYCDMTSDGGGWTKVFYHNYTNAGIFGGDGDASLINLNSPEAATKYSIFKRLDDFFRGGVYELKLSYPTLAQRNHWTQTSNPYTNIDTVTGYAPIAIDVTSNSWGGLSKCSRADTFMDGSPSSGTWFYAVGSRTVWSGAFPGPAAAVPEVEVWVK